MIDLIGDIHGHADELEALLQKLGYVQINGCYRHPESKVIFVGDYIDRGPKIKECLEIIKKMVDHGQAIALMGNHEYNAICYHLKDEKGQPLRAHSDKNRHQHHKTLEAFEDRPDELEAYIQWFLSLPLYFENEQFRVVHACWDEHTIHSLREQLINDRLTIALVHEAQAEGSTLHTAIEQTLKGKEIQLLEGISFADKDGFTRNEVRIKWWDDPSQATYQSISLEPIAGLPAERVQTAGKSGNSYYAENEKPVFFGHYWLKGNPSLYRENICCLDYSVAKKGLLTAYRFNGEERLSSDAFSFVESMS
ncbi:MAG: metallophosphoesterase [Cyclobacteriaceae bacterium]|nr:metallophosphoesterase [Cyclobacteriaceae bacterium]MCH8517192.1 metallophosphoesterase [Cyclobacteriaceae bacterium]